MTSRLYDPHQLRQKANRYYQRKGQILQVKDKNSDFGMVTRKQAAKMKPYVDAYFPPSSSSPAIICTQSTEEVHPLILDGQIITLSFYDFDGFNYTIHFLQSPDNFTVGDIRISVDNPSIFFGSFSKGFISFFTDIAYVGYWKYNGTSWIEPHPDPESIPFDFYVKVFQNDKPMITDAFIYSIVTQ